MSHSADIIAFLECKRYLFKCICLIRVSILALTWPAIDALIFSFPKQKCDIIVNSRVVKIFIEHKSVMTTSGNKTPKVCAIAADARRVLLRLPHASRCTLFNTRTQSVWWQVVLSDYNNLIFPFRAYYVPRVVSETAFQWIKTVGRISSSRDIDFWIWISLLQIWHAVRSFTILQSENN